jgi:hypothetical protein
MRSIVPFKSTDYSFCFIARKLGPYQLGLLYNDTDKPAIAIIYNPL